VNLHNKIGKGVDRFISDSPLKSVQFGDGWLPQSPQLSTLNSVMTVLGKPPASALLCREGCGIVPQSPFHNQLQNNLDTANKEKKE